MKFLSCATAFFVLFSAFSRPPVYAQQPEKVWDPWFIRAESVTDSLIKDSGDLKSSDRPLLWARLGIAWLSDDPDRAHAWMKKAVDEVEIVSDGESAIERRRRWATARSLLSIIAPRDKQLGSRLLAILEAPSDPASSGDRRDDANGLVDSALALVESDPERAAKVGSAALRIGLGYRLATLLWQLRKRDSKLSDSLFYQILTVAGATYDQEALGWLAQFAFHGQSGQSPADQGKARLLSVLAVGLLRLAPAAGNEEKACGLAAIVAPLLEEFNRLLPQQAPLVSGALVRCQQNLKSLQGKLADDPSRNQPLASVDQLVKAADDAPNQAGRDDLLYRAAQMAAEEKGFAQAIALLDLISDEGRKQTEGGWEGWRWSYASAAAVVQLKKGNRSEMQRIIAATTSSVRPSVQLSVAREMISVDDRVSAVDLLTDARKGMSVSSARDRVGGYMSLVSMYVELLPADAISVLNEAVKAINNEEAIDKGGGEYSDMYARINVLSNDLLLQQFKLPVALFEIDDIGVREALSAIKGPTKRSAIRLNLLRALLEQHRVMITPPRPIPAKDGKNVQ